MKILQSGDFHIGDFRGPEEDGINMRSQDTIRCLEEIIRVAREEKPDYSLICGDLLDRAEVWQARSHKEVLQVRNMIAELSMVSREVCIIRGTPNHDSINAFMELDAHFSRFQ